MRNPTQLTAILFITLATIFSACTSQRDKEVNAIAEQEEQLKKADSRPERVQLDELLNKYISFVDKYPQDTASTLYLYRAVNLTMGMGDGQAAMKLIDRTINEYPKSSRLAETVFLKAYVYENILSEYGKAAAIYRDFATRFPDHELADDAQIALNNMGKSPEELIREFEAQNAQKSDE